MRAPIGAQPVPRRRKRWTPARAWRAAAAVGALLGVGGYIATFVALVLGAGIAWAPALMAGGAAGGAASALAW